MNTEAHIEKSPAMRLKKVHLKNAYDDIFWWFRY